MAKATPTKPNVKPNKGPKVKSDKRTAPAVQNRQAGYNYSFGDRYVAGIMLTGPEVKSVRAGKVQLVDAYCAFHGTGIHHGLYVLGMQISPYTEGSYNNLPDKRPRKLLLNKTELKKLQTALQDKGTTVVPTRLFFNDRNLAKLDIAVAKGKKTHDKRDTIKARDTDRAMRRGED